MDGWCPKSGSAESALPFQGDIAVGHAGDIVANGAMNSSVLDGLACLAADGLGMTKVELEKVSDLFDCALIHGVDLFGEVEIGVEERAQFGQLQGVGGCEADDRLIERLAMHVLD